MTMRFYGLPQDNSDQSPYKGSRRLDDIAMVADWPVSRAILAQGGGITVSPCNKGG